MEHLEIRLTKKAFTHGGVFHADDVFSAALLKILNPNIWIERGMQVPMNYEGLVFDIGGGKYDHHQRDARVRENGVPYAAFGLLWEAYGELLLESEDAKTLDKDFVQPLDCSDNTGASHPLAQCVSEFIPRWDEKNVDFDDRFEEAVSWAKSILERKIQRIRSERTAYQKVRESLEQKQGSEFLFEMSEVMPWKEALRGTDVYYVVFPSARGGYMVQAVPMDDDKTTSKRPFPKEWRGKTAEELQEITGINTFRFCHNAGFLCVADTKEDAKRIAEIAMKTYEEER